MLPTIFKIVFSIITQRSFSENKEDFFLSHNITSELGKKKGLVIMLDAHSNILSPGSGLLQFISNI